MRVARLIRTWGAWAFAAVAATTAVAQDYVVTSTSNQWVNPPTGATSIRNVMNGGIYPYDEYGGVVSLPMAVNYYGTSYTSVFVHANGYVQFGSTYNPNSTQYSFTFPFGSGNVYDGVCAVAVTDLDGSNLAQSDCKMWVEGSAPDRKVIIAWLAWGYYTGGTPSGSRSFQVQFHEGGRIVMAYQSGGNWGGIAHYVGMDSVTSAATNNKNQYNCPNGGTSYSFTSPPNDWQYAPPLTFRGRLLFDRFVSDASGIGNSVEQAIPLAGIRVEERNGSGATLAAGTTDSTGSFSFSGTIQAGASLVVVSQSTAGAVRASAGGALYALPILVNQSFSADVDIGTVTLNTSLDPDGSLRAPINIARTMTTVYDWARTRTAESIPVVDPVLYARGSSAAPTYVPKNGTTPASMTVSGAASNDDAWDVSVIRTMYGRHVLASVAGDAGTTFDSTFDKATDAYNAFAEGFGHYMNAVVSGDAKHFDGTSASASTAIDYESPTMTTRFGADVAGWVAASLFDLIDPANESWDTFNGVGAPGEQVFATVASMSARVDTAGFFSAWVARGYDATGLARNFIHYGLIPDDPDEPNDAASEAFVVNQFGFIRPDRVLS
jgi:hypothetical protein